MVFLNVLMWGILTTYFNNDLLGVKYKFIILLYEPWLCTCGGNKKDAFEKLITEKKNPTKYVHD